MPLLFLPLRDYYKSAFGSDTPPADQRLIIAQLSPWFVFGSSIIDWNRTDDTPFLLLCSNSMNDSEAGQPATRFGEAALKTFGLPPSGNNPTDVLRRTIAESPNLGWRSCEAESFASRRADRDSLRRCKEQRCVECGDEKKG